MKGRLIKALGCVAGLLAALFLALLVSNILGALVGLPLPLKALLTVVLIVPLGFVMGMPFPTALNRLEEWHPPSVRWAWSLNAASSVLGSVGALGLFHLPGTSPDPDHRADSFTSPRWRSSRKLG